MSFKVPCSNQFSVPMQKDEGEQEKGRQKNKKLRLCQSGTFIFLCRGDACELGVDLVVLRDLEHSGAVLYHPGQQVRPPRDLEDVLNVRQVICRGRAQFRLRPRHQNKELVLRNSQTQAFSPWASLSFFSR